MHTYCNWHPKSLYMVQVSSILWILFVLQHFQDIYTTRGQYAMFECRVQDRTTVQAHWYKEKEQIADSDNFQILRKSIMINFSICFYSN